jgi:hypothetical protein
MLEIVFILLILALIIVPDGKTASQLRAIVSEYESRGPGVFGRILLKSLAKYREWKAELKRITEKIKCTGDSINEPKRRRTVADIISEHGINIDSHSIGDDVNKSTGKTYVRVCGHQDDERVSNWMMLDLIKPQWIIIYTPDISIVRKLEMYKVLNPINTHKVYFMVYDNSVEEQQYLTSLQKEKESFERLIQQKGVIIS